MVYARVEKCEKCTISMCDKWSMQESKNAKNALSHFSQKNSVVLMPIYAKNCNFDNYARAIYYHNFLHENCEFF